MDVSNDDFFNSTQPSATTPQTKDPSDHSHGDKLKIMNSTPNGYNSVPNHKPKPDGQVVHQKHHESSSKHSDPSKHNSSDHIKSKDPSKHHSGHSKSEGSEKTSSHKSNDVSKHKEHGHDKEKKHSTSSSKHATSDHSKHDGLKNGTEKVKSDSDKIKKHKSSDSSHKHSSDGSHKHSTDGSHKHSSDGSHKHSTDGSHKHSSDSSHKHSSDGKKLDKSKEDKPKDKVKSDHSSEHKKPKEGKEHEKHKESKDKTKLEGSKEKHSEKPKDKPKEKHGEKPKDTHPDKHKDKSEKPKDMHSEKHKDKSEKPKDMHSDKHKDKSEKHKDKSEKHKDKSEKHKDKGEKHKDKSEKSLDKSKDPIKIKIERTPEKKEYKKVDQSIVKVEPKSPTRHNEMDESFRSTFVVKQEPASPGKEKEEPMSEDDMPLTARKQTKESKQKPAKKKYEESSEDDEPISKKINKAKKIKAEESSKKRKAPADEDDDYNDYKPAKKIKKEKATKPKPKGKQDTTGEVAAPKKRGKKEDEQEVWKWWEEEKKEDGVKWNTLEHNGPVFAPLYERVPKSVKFYYDGKHVELSEATEEVAGFYGRMLDHEYTTKESFNTNFFKDWRKVMTPEEKELIKDLKKCNFNSYNEYYKQLSEQRKNMTKEEKAEIKKQNEELTQKYGFCIVDGHKQKIGNFKIEPPGLFRGRGEHPKMGMLKRRVQPEDISINIGKEAKIPDPPEGHKWKKVLHDNKVTWLASWNENILNSTKYIMLNPSSKLKGEKDWQKYETARKLKNHADQIRATYQSDFKSKEMRVRQRAVALYFIDKLALRAGNEKDEDTADTVGCCSLRVEHITLDEEKDGQEYVVSFDFLGKDCVRYVNSVPVEKRAFKNLKLFMENKQPGDDLFDRLNTTILNKYLNELMEGLTAKVFRTYNASKTLQEQLDLLTKEEMSIPEKMLAYNRANRAVAVLCNHQRAVPKTFSKSMENLKTKIDEKLAQIKECKKELKQAKNGGSKDRALVDKKKRRLEQLELQLKKLEVQATDKEENKQIALGTSKLNYLDPRISVAWCKKWDVPIEKIYNRTQRDKFRWAIEMAGPDFVF